MMKHEFCERAKINEADLNDEDYSVIEFVYARHPIIDCHKGKQQIADIYNLPGGMRIIRDMVATATKAEEITNRMIAINRQIDELRHQLEEAQREYNELKK